MVILIGLSAIALCAAVVGIIGSACVAAVRIAVAVFRLLDVTVVAKSESGGHNRGKARQQITDKYQQIADIERFDDGNGRDGQ